jgi:SSS family solute:Na+ symporter
MLVGMVTLIIYTYARVGGIFAGHQTLTDLADLVPPDLKAIGHRGWTAMPEFGFGDRKYNLWWTIISSLTLGVGIGVLAQPQLVVRFMTVKGKRELNRAVGMGGVFILAMVGVAYLTGSLTNAYFALHGSLFQGRVIQMLNEEKNHALLQVMTRGPEGEWLDSVKETSGGKTTITTRAVPVDSEGRWLPVTAETTEGGAVREGVVMRVVLDKDMPYLPGRAGSNRIAQGRGISINYAKGVSDQIIPAYIASAMPKWFGLLFLLTLLAAAMSTLSSQFHTLGTAAGHDVFESLAPGKLQGRADRTILIVRIAIILGLVAAVVIGYYANKTQAMVSVIARATAIFFGLCASTFMPAFIGGLFFRGLTAAGAIASMVTGFVVSALWIALVKLPECRVIGLVKDSILADCPNWPVVDSILIALPASTIVAVIVSFLTKQLPKEHLDRCFA